MASLQDLYIKKETLKILLDTVEKKGENGVSITISTSDESNEYGQNSSAWVSQSKEQREAGIKKFYVGNGKVYWTDGKITKAESKKQQSEQPKQSGDDLPF